ncbi:putative baseplate structural protein [Escherichia coli]|nr:hypothetical protein [Escherichia coli]STM65095.1 putative baseplate structural protein [Escherichia coli]
MSKTTPTKDSIRAEFEELVEKDSFWSKFVGSQFVSMLTLFITPDCLQVLSVCRCGAG